MSVAVEQLSPVTERERLMLYEPLNWHSKRHNTTKSMNQRNFRRSRRSWTKSGRGDQRHTPEPVSAPEPNSDVRDESHSPAHSRRARETTETCTTCEQGSRQQVKRRGGVSMRNLTRDDVMRSRKPHANNGCRGRTRKLSSW